MNGKYNPADFLSRQDKYAEGPPKVPDNYIYRLEQRHMPKAINKARLIEETNIDRKLQKLVQAITNDDFSDEDVKQFMPFKAIDLDES
jgi:hypothetical protein